MRKSNQEVLKLAEEVVEIIEAETLTESLRDRIVHETVDNFRRFLNKGIIKERKSALSEESFIEWDDEGAVFRDLHGNEFVDCLGGYGVYLLGHRHPAVVKAVEAQLKRHALHSQELLDPLRGYLAKLLAYITPGDLQKTYFVNSGSEAVEMAIKLARLATGREAIISTDKGFHGQTLGALSATGKQLFRDPFKPLIPEFYHSRFGDAEDVERIILELEKEGKETAGVIVEPIQGEGGINVPPDDYMVRLRRICDQHGCLLIVDEVQTGMGRTGKLFGVDHSEVVPDIMALGKALGGGVVPIAAVITKEEYWHRVEETPSLLGTSTFGGNPLSCAGAIACIKTIILENIPKQAKEKGAYILAALKKTQAKVPGLLVDVRGRGLMIGMEFVDDLTGFALASRMFEDRILIGGTVNNSRVLRFQPPAIINWQQIDYILKSIEINLMEMGEKEI